MKSDGSTREIHPAGDYRLERLMAWITILLFLLTFVAYAQAQTAPPVADVETLELSEIGEGALLIDSNGDGRYQQAPTVSTAVDIRVSGMFARAHVSQTFRNPLVVCSDALYVFPLPENAGVDRMTVTNGDRKIEGVIREKAQAQKEYEQAKSEGRRASLLDQRRPNVFTVSVANMLPNETVVVEIEYQQMVRFDSGRFSLRFPTVVAERYTPGASLKQVALPPGIPVPPVLRDGSVNRMTLRVDLESGLPLTAITSGGARIEASQLDATRHTVTLRDGEIPTDRDFELTWTPQLGSEPTAAVFVEEIGGARYGVVTLLPPAPGGGYVRLPRETIFIIDTSGSMEGTSMEQAKEALAFAVQRLQPADTFNIIEFNSILRTLWDESRRADGSAVDEALEFVEGLESTGGTEMLPALERAFRDDTAPEHGVRQIVFITDGQVSNEDELFTVIRQRLGGSRLFTVGIGSAPNSHFMNGAAKFGRGTFTYVGEVSEVEKKMTELFDKLDTPVLTDVNATFDAPVERGQSRLRDLYLGEPLMVSAKLGEAKSVMLSGRIGERSWSATLPLGGAVKAEGVAKIWARDRIESLTDDLMSAESDEAVRAEAVRLALEHGIVSKYTSLVAVDRTEQGLTDGRCGVGLVALNKPAGSGALPQTGTPSALLVLLGASLASLAIFVRSFFW